jgi:hypothetical protein
MIPHLWLKMEMLPLVCLSFVQKVNGSLHIVAKKATLVQDATLVVSLSRKYDV